MRGDDRFVPGESRRNCIVVVVVVTVRNALLSWIMRWLERPCVRAMARSVAIERRACAMALRAGDG